MEFPSPAQYKKGGAILSPHGWKGILLAHSPPTYRGAVDRPPPTYRGAVDRPPPTYRGAVDRLSPTYCGGVGEVPHIKGTTALNTDRTAVY